MDTLSVVYGGVDMNNRGLGVIEIMLVLLVLVVLTLMIIGKLA